MEKKIKIQVRDLNLYYGQNHALHGVNMDIKENSVTALIGPSGCGKSTFLKCINRMNDLVDNVRIEGSIEIDGENICTISRYNRTSQKGRHGFPAAKSVPDEHI